MEFDTAANSNTSVISEGNSGKPPKSTIYTKRGDSGSSSLFTGEKLPKSSVIFEALGTIDELSANIGVARQYCIQSKNGLNDYLEDIQSDLIDIGASIATPRKSEAATDVKLAKTSFDAEKTIALENWIDYLDAQLPPLKNFILPSGGFSSSFLHVSRSVCRRSERVVWPLVQSGEVENSVAIYLNRLSDLLFVCARYAAMKEGSQETSYKQGKRSTHDMQESNKT